MDTGAILRTALMEQFPDAQGRSEVRELIGLLSRGAAAQVADRLRAEPVLLGQRTTLWVPASDDVDFYLRALDRGSGAASGTRLSERQIAWVDALASDGRAESRFNGRFLTAGDSREPELAGIGGALVGSALTLLVTLAVSFPLGVAAAVYLEEFAADNRWTVSSRSTSTTWRPCPRSCSACWASRSFSASSGCRARLPSWAG